MQETLSSAFPATSPRNGEAFPSWGMARVTIRIPGCLGCWMVGGVLGIVVTWNSLVFECRYCCCGLHGEWIRCSDVKGLVLPNGVKRGNWFACALFGPVIFFEFWNAENAMKTLKKQKRGKLPNFDFPSFPNLQKTPLNPAKTMPLWSIHITYAISIDCNHPKPGISIEQP